MLGRLLFFWCARIMYLHIERLLYWWPCETHFISMVRLNQLQCSTCHVRHSDSHTAYGGWATDYRSRRNIVTLSTGKVEAKSDLTCMVDPSSTTVVLRELLFHCNTKGPARYPDVPGSTTTTTLVVLGGCTLHHYRSSSTRAKGSSTPLW